MWQDRKTTNNNNIERLTPTVVVVEQFDIKIDIDKELTYIYIYTRRTPTPNIIRMPNPRQGSPTSSWNSLWDTNSQDVPI